MYMANSAWFDEQSRHLQLNGRGVVAKELQNTEKWNGAKRMDFFFELFGPKE